MTSAHMTAQRYQQAQVETADRGRLLLLMFEGAHRFLALAEEHLQAGELPQFGYRLGRAQAVIAELLHTLDHRQGGEIAANLERLYRFMLDHLLEANLHKSPRHIAQVRRVLAIVSGAFRDVLEPGARVDAA